jgi:hypothetical protein
VSDQEQAKAEAQRLQASKAYQDKLDPEHQETAARVTQLFLQAEGGPKPHHNDGASTVVRDPYIPKAEAPEPSPAQARTEAKTPADPADKPPTSAEAFSRAPEIRDTLGPAAEADARALAFQIKATEPEWQLLRGAYQKVHFFMRDDGSEALFGRDQWWEGLQQEYTGRGVRPAVFNRFLAAVVDHHPEVPKQGEPAPHPDQLAAEKEMRKKAYQDPLHPDHHEIADKVRAHLRRAHPGMYEPRD